MEGRGALEGEGEGEVRVVDELEAREVAESRCLSDAESCASEGLCGREADSKALNEDQELTGERLGVVSNGAGDGGCGEGPC